MTNVISHIHTWSRPSRWLLTTLTAAMLMLAPWLGMAAADAQDGTPGPAQPLVVAASTPIFADITANIGGDRVSVWSVIPSGADPHTWEASPREIVRLLESDTLVFMGAFLEPFIESGEWRRALRDAAIPELELAEQMELITVDRVIDHGDHVHDLRGGDPHVWLDPLKTIEMVDVIAAHLIGLDPAGAKIYSTNAASYQDVLRSLHAEYEDALAAIPAERRKLVVFHDAYTYFAARYGFRVVGVVLPNPEAEPSAQRMAELVSTINAERIDVVFAEPQFDRGLLESLANETGAEIGMLLTDTFADEIDTYLELMRFNLESLREHLVAE